MHTQYCACYVEYAWRTRTHMTRTGPNALTLVFMRLAAGGVLRGPTGAAALHPRRGVRFVPHDFNGFAGRKANNVYGSGNGKGAGHWWHGSGPFLNWTAAG